ncbi:glycoside hydrolase, partial [Massarina eburnea CBS 473.64]
MMRLHFILLLAVQLLASTIPTVYTGFNYGAFWGSIENCKTEEDFTDSFNLAKSLDTPVPFDTARIFTARSCLSSEPSEAFAAAVKTNTKLLVGFYITVEKGGNQEAAKSNNVLKDELGALKKALNDHGEKLANLIVGVSVGNEDIYEWANHPRGATQETVQQSLDTVRAAFQAPPFAQYMKDKPIGHTETAGLTNLVSNVDFIGMNAYPSWEGKPIEAANASYHGALDITKNTANGKPVWLTEVGWPVLDSRAEATPGIASVDHLQRFWNDVGCSLLGKHNMFWFELQKDSEYNQPDWS